MDKTTDKTRILCDDNGLVSYDLLGKVGKIGEDAAKEEYKGKLFRLLMIAGMNANRATEAMDEIFVLNQQWIKGMTADAKLVYGQQVYQVLLQKGMEGHMATVVVSYLCATNDASGVYAVHRSIEHPSEIRAFNIKGRRNGINKG